MSRAVTPVRAKKGEEISIEVEVEIPPGLALVELHQPLPPEFVLDGGSNVHVVASRPSAPRKTVFRVKARATRRGTFALAPVEWEISGLLGLEAPRSGKGGDPVAVEVVPRATPLTLSRGSTALVRRAAAAFDRGRFGARGTDYKELREYAWGDPPKSINWKATARRMAAGSGSSPLVNDYEREGKRTVFLLVDASRALEVGTTVESALDHALDAAQGLAQHYSTLGYRVGAYAFNARAAEPVYPDVGREHARRVRRMLATLEPGDATEGLPAAVEKIAAYLHEGATPIVFVITHATPPGESLVAGLKRLRSLLAPAPGGSRAPVLVLSVRPYGLEPAEGPRAEEARRALAATDAPVERDVQRTGARLVVWDPTKGGLARVLLKGMSA